MQPHVASVAHTPDLFGDQAAPPPRSPAERKAFLEGTFRNINAVLQRAEIREKLATAVPGAFAYVSCLDRGGVLDRGKKIGREILATRVDCERPELSADSGRLDQQFRRGMTTALVLIGVPGCFRPRLRENSRADSQLVKNWPKPTFVRQF